MTQKRVVVRRSEDRGTTSLDWLDSRHTFSFGGYHDPANVGFRALRVINEDRVRPSAGFGTHPHSDMEIITVVIEGSLEHRDNLGNGSVILPGEVQLMSAGRGIMHSELNPSDKDVVRFLQIWIEPDRRGLAPSYEQRAFPLVQVGEGLRLVASPDGTSESLALHQDARIYRAIASAGESFGQTVRASHHAWIQVINGSLALDDVVLNAGDGASISDAKRISLKAHAASDLLLFDLA